MRVANDLHILGLEPCGDRRLHLEDGSAVHWPDAQKMGERRIDARFLSELGEVVNGEGECHYCGQGAAHLCTLSKRALRDSAAPSSAPLIPPPSPETGGVGLPSCSVLAHPTSGCIMTGPRRRLCSAWWIRPRHTASAPPAPRWSYGAATTGILGAPDACGAEAGLTFGCAGEASATFRHRGAGAAAASARTPHRGEAVVCACDCSAHSLGTTCSIPQNVH